MRLSLYGAILGALTVSSLAQEPAVKKTGTRNTDVTAITARKAALSAKLSNAAAASQLASIRSRMHSMLSEVALNAARSGELDEMAQFGEDELLKLFAVQLQEFIQQFKSSKDADAARVLLARIYIKLDQLPSAMLVLKDFDPDQVAKSELLQVVMTMAPIADLTAKADAWLALVGHEGEKWQDRFDAVFVAARLAKWDLAAQMLADIRQSAKTPSDKATVVLAEGDLIARLGISCIIPVNKPYKGGCFMVNPVVAAKLDANQVPVGSWRQVKASPTDASYDATKQATEDAKRRDADLRKSDLYKLIVIDAAPGLRTIKALQPIDGSLREEIDERYIAPSDKQAPSLIPSVDMVKKALLFKAVHMYPGTDAAKKAAVLLHADSLTIGDAAIAFEGTTTDGRSVSSAELFGKVVLLDFFSAADMDSLLERDLMVKLYAAYAPLGLEIVSVSLDDGAAPEVLLNAADEFGITWPILFDGMGPHTRIAESYGVQALPARLLIGRDFTVCEDRAWKLAPDELEASIRTALGAAKKPITPTMAAFAVEDRYYGPKVDIKMAPVKEDPTRALLEAAIWVADAGYRLTVKKVEAKADAVKVYLDLELQGWQTDADLQLRTVQVPIAVDLLKAAKIVKVYVSHKMADPSIKVEPALCEVIDFDETMVGYGGPAISINLLSTDGLPPDYTAVLATDLPRNVYAMELDGITTMDTVTKIMVRIAANPETTEGTKGSADPTGDPADKDQLRLVVPLGVDVGKTVEVWAAKYDRDSGAAPNYTLAGRVARQF